MLEKLSILKPHTFLLLDHDLRQSLSAILVISHFPRAVVVRVRILELNCMLDAYD